MPDTNHADFIAADDAAAPEADRRTRWRRPLVFAGLAVFLLAAVAAGSYWLLVGRYLEETDDAYLKADTVTVSPKVAGYVAEVLVRDNQQVAAGQVMVRIDDRDYRAELVQSEAQKAAAAADLRNVEAQIGQQKARIAAGEAQVASAGAQADYAAGESERYRGLISSGAVSRQREQLAQTDLKRSAAGLNEARAMLQTEHAALEVLESQRDKAKAAVDNEEAAAEQSRLRLSFTTIAATEPGVVGDRAVRAGQLVQPGTRLMTLVPVRDIYLVANFKETQLGQLYRGETVSIVLDAFPGRTLTGHVESLAPGTGSEFALLPPENASGNFTRVVQRVPVKIAIDPASLDGIELRPGLSATATVDTRTAPRTGRTTLSLIEK
jgi:membrane fusion protein (multidrug efflux system)